MLTRANFLVRPAAVARVVVAAVLFLAYAAPATGQGAQADSRWQAWLGCWTPTTTLIRSIGRTAASAVCVVPGSSASSVDILSVSNGRVIDRTHVDTDGQQHAISKEGCAGWESAKWSPSARRVYLKSEFTCASAVATHVSAIYAMAGAGEWIDVQGVRVDKNVGVHAIRYREAADPGALPSEITQKLQERSLSKMASVLAVSETPSIRDIEEASRELDPSVVSTWLVEIDKVTIQKPEPVNARQLEQLADAGVPASVIDVMVGLSYPKVLAVNPVNNGQMARQGTDSAYSSYEQYGGAEAYLPARSVIGFDRFGYPIYSSDPALMNDCLAFGYGLYNLGWSSPYSQFNCGYGYSPYSLGFGGYPFFGGYPGYGGYYGGGYYGVPVVVPRGSGTPPAGAPSHGRVVNGHGYSQGANGSSGTAAPRSAPTQSVSASPPPPPPPPPARTAEPKKP
jgi:hypothetical protein